MFAYCNNNPVMYVDPTGEIAWWVVAIIIVAVIAVDHALAQNAPEGVAVHDDKGEDGFHDRFMYAEGGGANADENGASLVDLEMGLYEGTSKTAFGDISFAKFLTVDANAEADLSGWPSVEASGVASIYTISYEKTFNLFGVKVNLSGSLHYGAIGGGVEADFESARFKIVPPMLGIGCDFGIDFDK